MLKPFMGIDVQGLPIYQIMLIIGFISGAAVFGAALKKTGVSKTIKNRVVSSFLFATLIGVLVANIANWLIKPDLLSYSIFERFTQGGFSFIFGVLTLLGSAALLLRLAKVDVKYFINMFIPSVLMAQFFARCGCSFTGCCWGKEVNISGTVMDFPARELEAVFAITLFLIFYYRVSEKRVPIYLFSYGIFRFIIDFYRGDLDGGILGVGSLSPTQLISIVTVTVSGVLLFARPVSRIIKKEECLNAFKKSFADKIKLKPYQPLPNTYVNAKGMSKTAKAVIIILVVAIGVGGVFVVANPLNLSVIDDIKYGIEDLFGFIFEKGSNQNQIGQTTGLSITKLSEEEQITDDKKAELIIENVEPWFEGDIKLREKKTLDNGNKLYVFDQKVKKRVVLGKTQALVADEQGNALYVAADIADSAYTDEIIDIYTTKTDTIKNVFGDKVKKLEEMPCYYETEYGLLKAKHIIIGDEKGNPTWGVVVQEKDGKIVRITKPELGVISNEERNEIDIAVAQVKYELSENEPKEKEERTELANALLLAKDKTKLTDDEFEQALDSADEVASAVANATPEIFGQILTEETKKLVDNNTGDAEEAEKCAKKVESSFSRYDYDSTDDEAATSIVAQSNERNFKYEMNYASDTDVVKVTNGEPEKEISIEFKSDEPITAQIYNENNSLVTTVYTLEEETVCLSEAEGVEFTVKVKNPVPYGENSNPFDYRLRVGTQEVEEQAQTTAAQRAVKAIEYSYNRSSLGLFSSMYSEDGKTLTTEEAIVAGFAPGTWNFINNMDCGGCGKVGDITGTGVITDFAKTMIAGTILPTSTDPNTLLDLKGSVLTLTLENTVETSNSTAVKAYARITLDSLVVYDGYVFFRVETIIKPESEFEAEYNIPDIPGITEGLNEYLTEFNTDSLYSIFGNSSDELIVKSDLTSIYKLCKTRVEGNGQIQLRELDVNRARIIGYSDEKIADMEKYVARQNVKQLEIEVASLKTMKTTYEALSAGLVVGKDIYDCITSPEMVILENLCSKNETTEKLFNAGSMLLDIDGYVTDVVIDSFSDASAQMAKEINGTLAIYEEVLKKEKMKLS